MGVVFFGEAVRPVRVGALRWPPRAWPCWPLPTSGPRGSPWRWGPRSPYTGCSARRWRPTASSACRSRGFCCCRSRRALAWLTHGGAGSFGNIDLRTDLLLMAGAFVTCGPLLCFGAAARLLPLSTLGFLQYLSPSVAFVLAVTVFGETVTGPQMVSFRPHLDGAGRLHRRYASGPAAADSDDDLTSRPPRDNGVGEAGGEGRRRQHVPRFPTARPTLSASRTANRSCPAMPVLPSRLGPLYGVFRPGLPGRRPSRHDVPPPKCAGPVGVWAANMPAPAAAIRTANAPPQRLSGRSGPPEIGLGRASRGGPKRRPSGPASGIQSPLQQPARVAFGLLHQFGGQILQTLGGHVPAVGGDIHPHGGQVQLDCFGELRPRRPP